MSNLYDNSEIATGVTIADAKTAMRVLGAFIETVQSYQDPKCEEIVDAMNFSYAFINSTVQHQQRILGQPEGMGSI